MQSQPVGELPTGWDFFIGVNKDFCRTISKVVAPRNCGRLMLVESYFCFLPGYLIGDANNVFLKSSCP